MFIELDLYNQYKGSNNDADSKMLIPVDSIVSIKEIGRFNLVFVKGLQLYAEKYYDQQQYKHSPEYIETETIEVTNKYSELKFLIQTGKATEAKDDK